MSFRVPMVLALVVLVAANVLANRLPAASVVIGVGVAGSGSGSWTQALVQALVVIPLGTVIPEEFAFRGVLWGLLHRRSGRWTATLVSSALFGLWHVAPALGGGSANQAVDE